MKSGQVSLLFTKLHRPKVGNDYVPRLRLLERLNHNPNRALTLVAALLAAFALADVGIESDQQDSTPPDAASAGSNPANLLLTPRELEVLRLLDSPLSDKEIAQKLFITVNTVKRHTGSIYQKLGVHSRRRAVVRAKGLHIAFMLSA